ncbi:MAG: hypothetical protein UGF89_02130 [Acutalibacteraceae bacterium]|nr:hypothetical protein [Acutalibacteraceae bacterium]
MAKAKKMRLFAFDLGDTVWYRYGHSFVVEKIEIIEKLGVLYRCGNPGTDDYWAFYESEIGKEAFYTKEEQEEALRKEDENEA